MIDKKNTEHLQERWEVHRGIKYGTKCPNTLKRKGDVHDPGKH